MLEITQLSAGYLGEYVLRELSLTVPEGSLTAIVGPNGCGKSTLLKAITGLLPCQGTVTFLGTALSRMDSRERAKTIAFLPQNRPIPEITAGKLVLHGRFPYLGSPRRYREADKKAAQEAMEQMGIAHLQQRYLPTLSGGERQKVYIAMLLAQGTPVVLMDEPTTYLDLAHKFEVMEIARQLTALGKAVVMVLHDLDLAMRYAHQIAVMQDGKIRICASPEAVSGTLEQVFRIRMGRMDTPNGTQYYFLPEHK